MGSLHTTTIPAASQGSMPGALRGNGTDGSTGGAVEKGVSQSVYINPYAVDQAIIIKWSIIGGIFALLASWIIIGHFHAKSRQRKGLPLLFYHRCLIATPKAEPPKAGPSFAANNLSTSEFYAPPPPAYDPNHPPPPVYQASADTSETTVPRTTEPSPSELEQQAEEPKKSLFTKIRNLGRRNE